MAFPSRITGQDGKRYPASWLGSEDRSFLAGRVHELHCVERLSVRKLLDRIEADHGIRRSVGWAAGILKTWRCGKCSGVRDGIPEHSGGVTA